MQKKILKNREERRLGIIGEVVGEMVKADYHTHKVGIPTQTHILDLSLPQSTKDSLYLTTLILVQVVPFCFCFWHVFSNHIYSVCTP